MQDDTIDIELDDVRGGQSGPQLVKVCGSGDRIYEQGGRYYTRTEHTVWHWAIPRKTYRYQPFKPGTKLDDVCK